MNQAMSARLETSAYSWQEQGWSSRRPAAAGFGFDPADFWVDPLIQGPADPCEKLLTKGTDVVYTTRDLGQRKDVEGMWSHLHRSFQEYATLEQALTSQMELPALVVAKDLETRSNEHLIRYGKGFDKLSVDEQERIRNDIAKAIAAAKDIISKDIKDLGSEIPLETMSEEERASAFETRVLSNFDAWRSTSATFRDTVRKSFLSTAAGKEGQDV